MSIATLGVLSARLIIDGGSRHHFGPEDAITGKIVLEYKPQSSLFRSTAITADLYGPLKLEATLRGKTKIIVKQERDMPAEHGCQLFLQAFPVFDGSFQAQTGDSEEFPFRIILPSSVGGERLPPTFSYQFAEFPDTVSLTVVYRVGVKLEVPRIAVKLVIPEHGDQPEIEYDLPRAPQASLGTGLTTVIQKASIKDQAGTESSNIRHRVKAVLASSPTAAVDISCTKLQHIFPSMKPHLSIRLHGENLSSASLISFRADLVASTWCKTDKKLKGPFERSDRRTLQKLACRTPFPLEFSKANDYTVAIDVDPIFGWPSTFKHSQITRRYSLRIKMKLKVAHESFKFDQEHEVVMVPKSISSATDEDLPAYQD
ncbi:hypothetical protein VTL71DRAFT_10056 [Oculimacula yallundae]|uniref:Arrestin-like N-terminal domain-containing protein n=1 Tax=Oculimacula yallundae TaxID=86028 RepID=A0ABR4BRN6_9HELO